MLTPYQFASNTPVGAIDIDGKEGLFYLELAEKAIFGTNHLEKATEGFTERAGEAIEGIWNASQALETIQQAINNDFGPYKAVWCPSGNCNTESQTTRILYVISEAVIEDYADLISRAAKGDPKAVGALSFEVLLFYLPGDEAKALKGKALENPGKVPEMLEVLKAQRNKEVLKKAVVESEEPLKVIGAAEEERLVKIGTIEGDVMIFSAKNGAEVVEGVTNFAVKDGKLYLNQLHLQGSAAGNVGREALWNMAKDLGKQYNVKEVIIQGGKRTTGKYKGTVPSPITIKVD